MGLAYSLIREEQKIEILELQQTVGMKGIGE